MRCHRHKRVLMSQLSYCNTCMNALALTAVQAQTSPTCTWTKLLRDETLLLDDRCPAVLSWQAFLALGLCACSQRTALVLSQASTRSQPVSTDFTRSQPHWTPLVPRQASPTRTHARMYVRTQVHVHHDPWGSLRLAPISTMQNHRLP